jgi:hypothetical protein
VPGKKSRLKSFGTLSNNPDSQLSPARALPHRRAQLIRFDGWISSEAGQAVDSAKERVLLRNWGGGDSKVHAFSHPWAFANFCKPTPEVPKLFDALPLLLPPRNPGIAEHVGNRILAANDNIWRS